MQSQSQTVLVKSIFDLIADANKETCNNISFIGIENYNLSPEETLTSAGIEFDKVLRFTDDSIPGVTESGYTMASAGGFTVNFLKAGLPASAIFLSSRPAGIAEEDNGALFWAIQALYLHHELMHAKDLKIERNFNISKGKVNLVKAEVYADVKTLKYFDELAKSGGDFFRNLYAAGIIGRAKTPIYTKIYNGIKKIIPEARLKAWASNSPLPPAEHH